MQVPKTQRSITILNYRFEGPYTQINDFANRAGVYTILDLRSDENWHVIDVGESSDVKDRLNNHDRKPCWNRHCHGTLGAAVLYTPGWTPAQRRTLESRIRATYSPPCGVR